jgi:site-specific DNA-cytosine methylase
MRLAPVTKTYRVGHLFCGVGSGAAGFNDANPRVNGVAARFVCAGGVDSDRGAIDNFDLITGSKGTVMDLFDREQFISFHGHEPPAGWREANPADIRRAHGDLPLDVMFLSAPCKGFSGLLSAKASGADKYQALNALTVRGVWLTLEAYKDDPIKIILFENVPRILTRGRALLDKIQALLRAYGYVFAETTHNCGEIGNLAQSRNRMLMVARHSASVPPFLYQPAKSALRGVGEVIGLLPLPGDPMAGGMHRVPQLQWKTWVRLAFVPAGKDWRALNDLAVEDGHLRDYGIVPEVKMRDNQLGVLDWADTAPVLTGQRSPAQGRFSVADPRIESVHNETLGVRPWEAAARVVAGASRPANGAHSVADPRPQQANQSFAQYGVKPWEETAATVTGQAAPGGGPNSIADPRLGRVAHSNVYRIARFDQPSSAVTSSRDTAVADPRATTGFEGAGKYRVTAYGEAAGTVIGGSTTGQGAFALADPRPTHGPNAHATKHKVVGYDDTAPVVTGSDRVGSGALSVADPRPGYTDAHHNVMKVTPFDEPAGTVTSGGGPSNGAISVADPRPVGLNADAREGYATQGHYGVLGWDETSKAVPGYAKYDRGNWSVADPRDLEMEAAPALPAANTRLVARIIARDGTWHRPFTTLELAALQSIFDPEEVFAVDEATGQWTRRAEFDLIGGSDQTKREWIGNAVPRAAARGMAETIGETLLLAEQGETFVLSSRAIWTKPLALALAVDPRQSVCGEVIL